ncbi:MAG: hypothetical protein OXC38_05740 [Gammaproteobacteria bacterium]|nr:hypothetical protein [Gammaproteobacteria bacterium]
MDSFRVRRILWFLLAILAGGTVFFYAAQQLADATPDSLGRTAAIMSRWKDFFERYGLWLHLGAHGATYLYLILRWPQLVCWVDRRRAARGYTPLSVVEQRRLVWAVITVCVTYEGLLMLRYLD